MSKDWNHGYYSEEGYEYGYQPETAPSHIRWACSMQGLRVPKENFTYLDLGCGQGLGLILHAANHPDSQFIGIDFMPTHIAHGRELAARLGLNNIKFIEADFIELAKSPKDIPEIDYAVAHGVSAWVSREVRDGMWELVSKVLKPGGIVYNGYNSYPYWYLLAPFQHLVMLLNSHTSGSKAIEMAIEKIKAMQSFDSPLFRILPSLKNKLDNLTKQDPAYLVQEYNNRTWEPKYISDMLDEVQRYKLDYLGTANTFQIMKPSYPADVYAHIKAEPTVKLKETIRDFAVGQSFRRDLYGRGSQKLWDIEKIQVLGEQRFTVVRYHPLPEDERFHLEHNMMKVTFPRDIFQRVLEEFGTDGKSVSEVQASLQHYTLIEVAEMASYLYDSGWLGMLTQKPTTLASTINQRIANAHLQGAPYNYLLQANLQKAIRMSNSNMMLYALHSNGISDKDLPAALHEIMLRRKLRFCIDGREIVEEREFLEQARHHTREFLEFTLKQIRLTNP